MDRRIRGRCEQRNGRLGLRGDRPGFGGRHDFRDRRGRRHRRHGRGPGQRHGDDPGRSDSDRPDHVQSFLPRRHGLLRGRGLQLDRKRLGKRPVSLEAFAPSRVGAFRWTVAYSGDVNHVPATTDCGKATSSVTQAGPSIAGAVKQRPTVGTSFQDTATLQGGYSPGGTITFRIYGPVAAGCAKPAFVDTVAVAGNGTVSSDPFVAQRPGRYSFVAGYSGDSANKAATEPCDSAGQVVEVQKRALKVKPRALLKEGRRISIRAHLSGGASPSGTITFRLYGPGDKRCKRKPAFSGGIAVKSNGTYSLAQYLAAKSGIYRLSVGYSGDQRNRRYKASCGGAQSIRVD